MSEISCFAGLQEVLLAAPVEGVATEVGSIDRVLIAGSFRFFWSTQANSKHSPEDITSTHSDGTLPDFVRTHLRQLIYAHCTFVEQMGLPDFFESGFFVQSGARFLDVVLDDIPVMKGIATAKVIQNTPAYLKDTQYDGLSICLRLHRALPFTSLTPAHELFHVFQYAQLPLRNMWFMEGLARHAQSWCSKAKPKTELLPSTQESLESLLHRWHDAEYFWNRISELCVPKAANRKGGGALPTPEVKQGNQTSNPHLQGQTFIRHLFAQCALQVAHMRADMPIRNLPVTGWWPLAEARSGCNAAYILRAIVHAVKACGAPPHPELDGFVRLIEHADAKRQMLQQSAPVQAFLRVMQSHGLGGVCNSPAGGWLHSDAFDPGLGCLSIPSTVFAPGSLSNEQLKTFIVVRHVIGHLRLKDQPQLTDLGGLDALRAVEGDLCIENTGVQVLADVLPKLERIKGQCQLVGNRQLTRLHGFQGLLSIDASLEVKGSPRLKSLVGFDRLLEIKKGALRLQALPQLSEIHGFSSLARARDVDVAYLAIRDTKFLTSLFGASPNFPGSVKLIYCCLQDLSGLAALRKTGSSLHLHNNRLQHVDALKQLSEVGASLSLGSNRLENINGLSSLKVIGGILSLHSNRLKNLSGLSSLSSVKTALWNKVARTINIYNNPVLTDIRGLSEVRTEDDYVILHCDEVIQYEERPDPASPFHHNVLQVHQGLEMRPFHSCLWTGKESHDYANFRRATHNKKLVYMHDFETHADTLVLSFSGVNGKLGGIFHNRYPLISEGVRTHKIFINDTSNQWYHGGIPGLTKNITETLEYLRTVIRQYSYKKIVCTGVSQGGYMSLLVGHQIGATDILVFAPQTYIDPDSRKHYGDRRWAALLKNIDSSTQQEFLDIAKVYSKSPLIKARIHVYFGSKLDVDVTHVNHVRHIFSKTHSYPVDTHYISRYLDGELGVLNELVRSFVVGGA